MYYFFVVTFVLCNSRLASKMGNCEILDSLRGLIKFTSFFLCYLI